MSVDYSELIKRVECLEESLGQLRAELQALRVDFDACAADDEDEIEDDELHFD